MSRPLIGVLLILVAIGIAVHAMTSGPAAAPKAGLGEPVTGMIGQDIMARLQAEVAMQVTAQTEAIALLQAQGTPAAEALQSAQADARALHARKDEVVQHLKALGDSDDQIARWLDSIHWGAFERAERSLAGGGAGP
jgi:hypothetical protein